MRKPLLPFLLLTLFLLSLSALQAQFTPGNLAIFRAESASANNTNFSIIELNPTTANQTSPVTTIAINGTTGATALRTSGSASSTGYLANSNDGALLCFTGHATTTATGNINTVIARGVGTLDANGNFVLAATYTGTSGNQTRCATTLDNSHWFVGDQGGGYTNNATNASPTGNFRGIKAFGGAAYVFQASASLPPVGILSAPSGGTLTGLPGLANGSSSCQDFYMISSGSNGTAFDVLYVLAASSATSGTLSKYSLVASSWVANSSYTTSFGGFGLAVAKAGSSASLYVTTGTGATAANNLVQLTDAAGYNADIAITTANNVVLYTAPAGTTLTGVAFAPTGSTPLTGPVMRITEWMYGGANGEFVEFTNTGNRPVDMHGWSYSDNTRHPGDVLLDAFGIVQPGESVILTESPVANFRAAWGLCNGVKIIGDNSVDNLGRNDEINLYDASGAQADRLTYGDQDFPGTMRTQGASGWVSAAGLGTNTLTEWTPSTVGDAESSITSTGGDIGSPGKSTRATITYTSCTVAPPGAPTIVVDVTNTTNALDGGATTSPASPFAISGVLNDPTDPASASGIDFTIGDDVTPAANLSLTVSGSNTTVVPTANLVLTGTGASRHLTITPAAVGRDTITLTVNDGTYNTFYTLYYAASSFVPPVGSTASWPTGISDASAAIALDDDYMVIGNDEDNHLYVFNRKTSGLPVKVFDFNAGNLLA
ncbi:MAG: lamin tail domain-containing protein, partial [Bacteroidota bacterium]